MTNAGEPAVERIRSPRKARERIDQIAVEIAAEPERWPSLVNGFRKALGRAPLAARETGKKAFQFFQCEIGGRSALYPIARLRRFGGGGMNAVLRSKELFSEREITVRKHLPAESAVEEALQSARDAIVRERLMTLPRNPVIQRFWAAGLVEWERCEVLDYAPGENLARYAGENGLTYGMLLDIGLHLARGLLHLHRHGLIHGDVKPQNICVEVRPRRGGSGPGGEKGEPVVKLELIDFDIVSSPEEQIQQYSLGNGLEGTLPYMPPENFRQSIPVDPEEARSMVFSKDVFALGLSLCRVIQGGLPESLLGSESALLQMKVFQEELVLELPESVPLACRTLIRAMCRAEWERRPDLKTVVQAFHALKESSTELDRRAKVAFPRAEEAPTAPVPPALVEHVGPYRIVNRAFAPRAVGDGQEMPLSELQDPFGRRLVGVPYAFPTKEEEHIFYEERVALLKDLNAVRMRHPELFPGSFRDLVREYKNGRHYVWVIRPLLEGAINLRQFLERERPEASLSERLSILRRGAEALAALEEAGYRLPELTPELIFFVPEPLSAAELAGTQAGLTRPIRRLFDLPGKAERRFRQELMGTASARRAQDGSDPSLSGFLEIAQEIRVLPDLAEAERVLFGQIAEMRSWTERISLLVWLEMEYTDETPTKPALGT